LEGSARDSLPADRLDDLQLSLVPGVGPRLRRALVEHFGSAGQALAATTGELRAVSGVGAKVAAAIRAFDRQEAIALAEDCRQSGVTILFESTDNYPRLLRDIPDPPPALFVRGSMLPQDSLAIAIVGTRHSTLYGDKQAERLGYSLAKAGLTIISGLARGIDAAAHRGALSAGGRTIGVLASGVLEIYPPEHVNLAAEIMERGAIVGESPPRAPPLPGVFPQRNRIISGLSLGVIVVEAPLKSGALSTTAHATEQNREVFAVPGPIDSRTSRGCHQLIRDGARLVESADDVLEELGPLVAAAPRQDGPAIRHPAELQLNAQEKEILSAIGEQPTGIDAIAMACQIAIPRVLATISVLEMRRLIRRVSGQFVVRV